ncbi:MAG TPA: TIGR02281 family clan AA aspartic protease [Pseudolabrys sp.]|nr:TIGR02281 family clan AA aspartic protease [Pseudolabrys sp.]
MRQIFLSAIVVLVAGGYLAGMADRAVEKQPDSQAAVVQPAYAAREPTSSGRSLVLDSDRQGHFQVEARVDGRFADFVVDTGASLVVLRESTASMVGIHPQPRDYTAVAVTANGRINAARATIERIEVGGITVFDVPAMILPDEALTKNLLGVSFLSRLKRYEYANGRLVLEQ